MHLHSTSVIEDLLVRIVQDLHTRLGLTFLAPQRRPSEWSDLEGMIGI